MGRDVDPVGLVRLAAVAPAPAGRYADVGSPVASLDL